MPVETRYERSDFSLPTVQGSVTTSILINEYAGNVTVTQYFQIKVYKLVGAAETLISTSNIGSRNSSGMCSFTGAIPLTAMNATDQVRIKIYADDFTPPTTLRGTWTTAALGASQLDAATWTFYCYLYRVYSAGPNVTDYYFRYNNSVTFNSRIENFSWSAAAAAAMLRRLLVGVGQ